jgi:hypothetical protein
MLTGTLHKHFIEDKGKKSGNKMKRGAEGQMKMLEVG